MSMQGGIGAATAAGEILKLVNEIKEAHKNNTEVLKVLAQIETKAQEIKTAGESGWY